MFYIRIFLVLFTLVRGQSSSFISVRNGRLTLNDRDYLYVGTNFWYGANLASTGPGGNRQRLLRELDRLHSLGIDNLRLQAGSEGPNTEPWRIVPSMQPEPGRYDENILDGLDFLLYEMGKRQMRAVMCLNNFWHWSGGYAQYVVWADGATSIPYPGDFNAFESFSKRFYELPRAVELFNNHIQFIMKRTNRYNNISYTEDPTIVSEYSLKCIICKPCQYIFFTDVMGISKRTSLFRFRMGEPYSLFD
jgi:mannan endo-1,4-beta-mannosidase